jgi:hypothetical protein
MAGAAATQAATACSYSASPASQVAPTSAPSNGERTGNGRPVVAEREPTMMGVGIRGSLIIWGDTTLPTAFSLRPAGNSRQPATAGLRQP